MKEKIRYIAGYQVAPVSAVTHIAEVQEIRPWKDTGKYVVRLRHFRGEIIVEEAGFFVRDYDPPTGNLTLSDRSVEPLDVGSLRPSPIDGALLCTIKRELSPAGLAARFGHNAQSELLNAVNESADGPALRFGGGEHLLPDW